MASKIAGERAEEVGFPSPDEVFDDVQVTRHLSFLSREAVLQARLSLPSGRHRLARAVDTGGAAYLGGKSPVLARAVTASGGTNLSGLFEELPILPLVETLIEEIQVVAGYTMGKLVDAVGASWAAFTPEKNPADR